MNTLRTLEGPLVALGIYEFFSPTTTKRWTTSSAKRAGEDTCALTNTSAAPWHPLLSFTISPSRQRWLSWRMLSCPTEVDTKRVNGQYSSRSLWPFSLALGKGSCTPFLERGGSRRGHLEHFTRYVLRSIACLGSSAMLTISLRYFPLLMTPRFNARMYRRTNVRDRWTTLLGSFADDRDLATIGMFFHPWGRRTLGEKDRLPADDARPCLPFVHSCGEIGILPTPIPALWIPY